MGGLNKVWINPRSQGCAWFISYQNDSACELLYARPTCKTFLQEKQLDHRLQIWQAHPHQGWRSHRLPVVNKFPCRYRSKGMSWDHMSKLATAWSLARWLCFQDRGMWLRLAINFLELNLFLAVLHSSFVDRLETYFCEREEIWQKVWKRLKWVQWLCPWWSCSSWISSVGALFTFESHPLTTKEKKRVAATKTEESAFFMNCWKSFN